MSFLCIEFAPPPQIAVLQLTCKGLFFSFMSAKQERNTGMLYLCLKRNFSCTHKKNLCGIIFVGQLTMIVQQPKDGPGRGWEDVGDGKMSAKMFRFLQRDIDEGRIWYQHMGASADADFFTFEVKTHFILWFIFLKGLLEIIAKEQIFVYCWDICEHILQILLTKVTNTMFCMRNV